ncbi:hypothetical protein BDZ94DRAFT_1312294 [Collybia nuda]|uniref:Uncharacterized protein n=1 Tax=Collybia nuda TaxID=64659 RepID=A0A9P5XZG6_9AGAR|nr:hypothetical protein BDZ94DRAFT_1312294 [Collybia nuda]
MAPSHSLFNSPRIPYHDHVPPTSPSLQMPNVFVVPPEEDQLSPWCCFDATEVTHLEPDLSTILDIEFLDGALEVLHTESHAPVFHRDADGPFGYRNPVIMPRKSTETSSITDVPIDEKRYGSDDELKLERVLEKSVYNGCGRRNVGEDSEIVEVVKVRRHDREGRVQDNTEALDKTSKSFKSRASKAFKTLKNVGKHSTRLKRQAQGILVSPPSIEDEPPPRARTPTMSRRGSVILSQLFNTPSPIKPCQSVSSFGVASSLTESVFPIPSSSSSVFHPTIPPRPLPDLHSLLDLLDPDCSPSSLQDIDHQAFRSPSPTPSTQTFSARRRFSIMSLQRIFSFSSPDHDVDAMPRTSNMSRDSTGPSSASSLGPDTPTEEVIPLPLPLHSTYSDRNGAVPQFKTAEVTSTISAGDISFEMRLDSLHFESLSFDADRF